MSPETEALIMKALELLRDDRVTRAQIAQEAVRAAATDVFKRRKEVDTAQAALSVAQNKLAEAQRNEAEVTEIHQRLEQEKAAALRLLQEGIP